MSQEQYALGKLVNGMAEGWHPMPSEQEAIKQAHTRSIERSEIQCIMHGPGQDDENTEVAYLVIAGEFYKRHDFDNAMEGVMLTSDDFTTDPIEGEVHAAVGRYKMALIRTGHRSTWHRFMCWTGGKEALSQQDELDQAERYAKEVIDKTPAHRLALETIVKQQPAPIARKDNLLSLMSESIEI